MSKRSQFGEDRHIAAVLAEIGEGSRVCCEIGARLLYSNVAHLIEDKGWCGVLCEKSAEYCAELFEIIGERAKIDSRKATIENVNDIVPADAWVLSIDVDSDDFWLWANLMHRPALVIVETNPAAGLHVTCYPHTGLRTDDYGMSLGAAVALGSMKGYDHIGGCGVNAFFVRRELACKYRLSRPERRVDVCHTHRNVLCAS